MKNLKEQAEKLAAQNCEIRQSIKEFMIEFAKATKDIKDEFISNNVHLAEDETLCYCLIAGNQDLSKYINGELIDFGRTAEYFYEAMSMADLRIFLDRLPEALTTIEQKIKEKQLENEKIISFFNKINKE